MSNASYVFLDLPAEAAGPFGELQKDIKSISPTKETKEEASIYKYGCPESCAKFSIVFAQKKLKPGKGQSTRPYVYGLNRGGFFTKLGYIGLAFLLSNTTRISIKSEGNIQTSDWHTGSGLLVMGGTTVVFEEAKEGNTEEGENRFRYYFRMISVETIS
ncbi:unnamed protein product [Clonostachys rosea f. rosea IK726]|uniref:Uncharacterized protein n=2 Tax=Bionectria ochroleuca TaxID=29856 RepID=A0A0B7KTC2_BIOOC|nr:unnamed protein product [Clonostachys rosea f. rosea IK726]